jgi:hypothetical protein
MSDSRSSNTLRILSPEEARARRLAGNRQRSRRRKDASAMASDDSEQEEPYVPLDDEESILLRSAKEIRQRQRREKARHVLSHALPDSTDEEEEEEEDDDEDNENFLHHEPSLDDLKTMSERRWQRHLRKLAAWESLSVMTSTRSILAISIFETLIVITTIILGRFVFAIPMEPLNGVWPSFGLFLFIPHALRFVFGLVAYGSVKLINFKVLVGVAFGLIGLSAYCLIVILVWIYRQWTGTLSAVAAAHFTAFGHYLLVIVLLGIAVFDILLIMEHFQVISRIPRELVLLGRQAGLSPKAIDAEVRKL